MTKHNTFERKCVACRSFHNKYEMIRLAKTDEGVFIDKNQRMQGRGTYVCNNEECIKTALEKNLFKKSLKCNIDNETLEELRNVKKE
ncbi:RNase P modulator RnpM [Fenollaria sporofastidiosus]|uniref:RNase P modulator RnpM n=2 Tax=Fenollaria sporofastidiosus TaxID=2811778 RepID=UPI001C00849F